MAVQTEEQIDNIGSKLFWIGKVLATVNQSGENYVKQIKVPLFNASSKEEHLQSQYYPSRVQVATLL